MVTKNGSIHYRQGKIHFFCPICKDHKSTKLDRKVGWRHHAAFSLATAAIMILGWPVFGLRAVVFYFPIWMGFELIHRMRKRVSLVCEGCGFDPFLYKSDVERAREAMRKHWQTKIEKENWYSGVKLKNYTTNPKDAGKQAPSAAPSQQSARLDSPRPGP